jgi:aspartate/methionine/tyrosine aminotransferase
VTAAVNTFGLDLPDYPWEAMAPYLAKASQHPGGAVNLSIGTPVDPTPALIQDALKAAADAPGYPTVHGTAALREAIASWFERRRGVAGLDPRNIMPTVGSKELVAWLPLLLGLKPGDVVVRPKVAYPTYDIGATFAGVTSVATDNLDELDDATRSRVRLIWVNSPGNPTDEWADYYKANVEFFDDLGLLGGAAKVGNTGKDHPMIAALPPQN